MASLVLYQWIAAPNLLENVLTMPGWVQDWWWKLLTFCKNLGSLSGTTNHLDVNNVILLRSTRTIRIHNSSSWLTHTMYKCTQQHKQLYLASCYERPIGIVWDTTTIYCVVSRKSRLPHCHYALQLLIRLTRRVQYRHILQHGHRGDTKQFSIQSTDRSQYLRRRRCQPGIYLHKIFQIHYTRFM